MYHKQMQQSIWTHTSPLCAVAYSVDGKLLAVAATNGEVIVLTTEDMHEWARRREHNSPVLAMRFV
jgi:WD40 repeat protein